MDIHKYNLDCGNPSAPTHGTVTLAAPDRTKFGDTATQSCNEGYSLAGQTTIRCQASGNWSEPPVVCTIKGTFTCFLKILTISLET